MKRKEKKQLPESDAIGSASSHVQSSSTYLTPRMGTPLGSQDIRLNPSRGNPQATPAWSPYLAKHHTDHSLQARCPELAMRSSSQGKRFLTSQNLEAQTRIDEGVWVDSEPGTPRDMFSPR